MITALSLVCDQLVQYPWFLTGIDLTWHYLSIYRYMDWYKKGPNHRHKGQDEQPMKQPDQEKSGRHCQDLAGYVDGMEDIQEYNISDDAKLEQQRSVTEEALRQDDLPSATQAQSGSDETAAIEERSLVPSRAEHPVSSSPKDLWIRPNSAEVLLD